MLVIVAYASLFFAALVTGGLMVNWIGLARAMRRLRSAAAYVEFHQATNHTFDPYMPIVVVGAVCANGLLSALTFWSAWPTVAALGYALILMFSLLTNVRINKEIADWSQDRPPPDWQATRARWVRFHVVRTIVSLPALLCSIAAVVER